MKVEGAAGDASKVTASGPGLEKTGVIVKTKTYFEVYTKGNYNFLWGNFEISFVGFQDGIHYGVIFLFWNVGSF